MSDKQELESLKQELSQLRHRFDRRVTELQARIAALEIKITAATDNSALADKPPQWQVSPQREADIKTDTPTAQEVVQPQTAPQITAARQQQSPPATEQARPYYSQAPVNGRPGEHATDKIDERAREVELWLQQLLRGMLGPFSGLYEQLLETYQSYKEQGKLPVFLLTAGGIVALIAGFGFILQYSFINLLDEIAKISLGFVAANGIIGLGAYLSSKKRMHEYGASIIGLGILLNYLCIYFLAAHFSFVSQPVGFALLVVNTIMAYVLAVYYETRIVASISFIGGVFTPFFLGDSPDASVFYLTYLLLLSAATLHLSRAVRWPSFATFSFVVVMLIFELFIFQSLDVRTHANAVIGLLHGFFYLYIYHALFDGFRIKQHFSRADASIFATSLALLLLNLFYVVQSSYNLGLLYLLNAVPFAVLILTHLKALDKLQRAVLFMLIGVFVGFAIPALFDANIMGLFWAQEALALIYLGFLLESQGIRKEAYVLFVIALGQTIWTALNIQYGWPYSLFNIFYLNLVTIGILFSLALLIFKYVRTELSAFDLMIQKLYREGMSFWIAVVYFITTGFLVPDYFLLLSIIPMFYLLYRGEKLQLRFTKYLGILHYAPILLQIGLAALQVQSFRFILLPLIGKIAVIEAFLLLFALQSFYQYFAPHSNWLPFARKLRIGFYMLLPLVFLRSVMRRFPDFFPMALWASSLISFVVYERVREAILRREFHLIVLVAWLVNLTYAVGFLPRAPWHPSFYSLLLGLLLSYLLWQREAGLTRDGFRRSEYKLLLSAMFIYAVLCLGLILDALFKVDEFALIIMGAACFYLALRWPSLPPLRNWLRPAYLAASLLISLTTYATAFSIIESGNPIIYIVQNVIAIALLWYVVNRSGLTQQLILGRSPARYESVKNIELYNLHLLIIAAYAHASAVIFDDRFGPAVTVAFVLHATFLLFQSVKKNYRSLLILAGILAAATVAKILLYDLRDFSLIQKILAFMAIGVIMLFAAYRYQKYRAAYLE